jgi:RNA polymerase sigma-70 factor (ECF subfamily)
MLDMSAAQSGSKRLGSLLRRIAAGRDQSAFAELYDATKGKLFATVLRIVRRRDIAEEIIQDAYARIWSNAGSYRPSSGSPMTWMIAIARHLAIDIIRKPALETCPDDSILLELPDDGPSAVELIEAAETQRSATERHQRVLGALQTLAPARRDLVIAAYIHGESRQQLSQRAGVPVSTVKTWIRRALLEVETILQNSGEDQASAFHGPHHRRDPAAVVHR